MTAEVISLAAAGTVHRYSLDDAPRAYTALREGTLEGRAVIVP